jgi:hypothetical protein
MYRERYTKTTLEVKKMSIGRFIEQAIENGEMQETDLIEIWNQKNNLQWRGKAGFVPIYADHMKLRGSIVDRETTRFYEV